MEPFEIKTLIWNYISIQKLLLINDPDLKKYFSRKNVSFCHFNEISDYNVFRDIYDTGLFNQEHFIEYVQFPKELNQLNQDWRFKNLLFKIELDNYRRGYNIIHIYYNKERITGIIKWFDFIPIFVYHLNVLPVEIHVIHNLTNYTWKLKVNIYLTNIPDNNLPFISRQCDEPFGILYPQEILIKRDSPIKVKYKYFNSCHDKFSRFIKIYEYDNLHTAIEYFENGNVKKQKWFQNDKTDYCEPNLPSVIEYYKNGNIKRKKWCKNNEYYYFDDLPNEIEWYENGTVKKYTWFNQNGQVHREGDLPAVIRWYNNGVIKSQEWQLNYYFSREDNLPHKIKYWDSGRIKEQIWYKGYDSQDIPIRGQIKSFQDIDNALCQVK